MRRYAVRRVRDGIGDDIASEVFARAFRVRGRYRVEHDSALPWLLGIANNVIADHRRLERRRLAALERVARETPRMVEHPEAGLAPEVVAALRALPGVERDTLLLLVWGELTQEEAAVAIGVPVGTISSRITRARKRLMETSLRATPPEVPQNFEPTEKPMPERSDLLAALRDVGVTPPTAGDTGDELVRSALQREIVGRRPRRRARRQRRAVLRCSAVGAAAVVAAGVVVATRTVGGSHGPAPQTSVGPVGHARDTAYIVRQVRTQLGHLAVAGQGQVLERTSTIGNGTAGRPTVRNSDWAYIDPRSGVAYQRSVDRSADGTTLAINELITTPRHNVLHTQVTFLNPSQHSYFTDNDAPPGGSIAAATSGTELGIKSTAQQVDQALRNNQVAQQGTATVDGQSTIKLSVPPAPQLVKAGLPRQTTITLYVNSQTYQPVQEIEASPTNVHDPSAGTNTSTSRWLPTTAATIALTKPQVPPGYKHASGPLHAYWTNTKPLFFIGY